ncbi:polymorphic toxin-type HINT domain-containing protein [Phytohabitans kaempferiae]|uniref:Polymorphic toxin-type HINT domain-containing protein n=1 Tax=Phytohabitans kaempferiae TaxID=1620943 RepID=A0ABV6LWX7_9ACTN
MNVGERVAATDPRTGLTTSRSVTRLHINTDTELTNVTVKVSGKGPRAPARAGAGLKARVGVAAAAVMVAAGVAVGSSAVVETTAHHPFWDETAGSWVDASELRVGHELRTADGRVATVTAVENFTGAETMRDLTVDTIHTYHVLAGNTPVLVHNCGEAEVHWDPDMKHAQITVTPSGGRAMTTEQVVTAYGPNGGVAGGPTTGGIANPMGPNAISIKIPLPDGAGARKHQLSGLGADLGPYSTISNSCVTYCVAILRAGGVDMPEGARGAIWLKRQMNNGG